MTRLTSEAAAEFIESVLDCPIDLQRFGLVEAFIIGKSVDDVRAELDEFLAERRLEPDPTSVLLTPDTLDLADDDCCKIVILTDERPFLS